MSKQLTPRLNRLEPNIVIDGGMEIWAEGTSRSIASGSGAYGAVLFAAFNDASSVTITDLSGNPRQIPDPSKTLRPSLGVERILVKSLSLKNDEKGPNGELVWEPQNKDKRIRYVGTWLSDNSSLGQHLFSSVANDFVEISFYGTGLNLALFVDGTSRDLRATIDNGVEGANFYVTGSNIISNRQYASNMIVPLATNLSLGNHTIKIRQNSGSTNFRIFGFEVLNESTQIKIPQGEIFANGLKFSNSTLQSISYNTGFDGNPVLNGRGGRVVEYIKSNGLLGKVIQQTNSSAAYLASADHSNEEVLRKINFREFGANRSDDFSTQTAGLDDNAFTLDDGSTTLVGNQVNVASGSTGVWPGTTNGSLILTFYGTGIDIIRSDTTGTIDSHDFYIDGTVIGNITGGTGSNTERVQKIASGLSLGFHILRIVRVAAVSAAIGVADFITYGPKRPSIPSDATELNEYYLNANYSSSGVSTTTTLGNLQIPQGTVTKYSAREFRYTGSYSYSGVAGVSGYIPHYPNTATNSDYFEYTFWGTGFVAWFAGSGAGTSSMTITVNGVLNASGVALQNMSNAGGGTYNITTATINAPCRVEFTGLSLAKHTVRFTKTAGAGNMNPVGLHIITPIHYPNTKLGSLSMGPAVQLKSSEDVSGVDLSKAKAWIRFNRTTGYVEASYNVAGVLTSSSKFHILWEKPFKNNKYVITGIGANYANGAGQGTFISLDETDPTGGISADKVVIAYRDTAGNLSASGSYITVIAFGELAEEESE